jgi:hypothetical protein
MTKQITLQERLEDEFGHEQVGETHFSRSGYYTQITARESELVDFIKQEIRNVVEEVVLEAEKPRGGQSTYSTAYQHGQNQLVKDLESKKKEILAKRGIEV